MIWGGAVTVLEFVPRIPLEGFGATGGGKQYNGE